MFLKSFLLVFTFLYCFFWGFSQDCTLDVGGKNSETIIRVFQLSNQQISKMDIWREELILTNKALEDDIQQLFETHPQSTPDELTALAQKYKVLQQKMVQSSNEIDKKLLQIFNKRQFARYLKLCSEAVREPFNIIPTGADNSSDDPN